MSLSKFFGSLAFQTRNLNLSTFLDFAARYATVLGVHWLVLLLSAYVPGHFEPSQCLSNALFEKAVSSLY